MKNSFINLLRQPDNVLFQYEDSDIRFEEPDSREEQNSKLDYIVENGAGKVILYPSDKPVKRVKLRWRGDMSDFETADGKNSILIGTEFMRVCEPSMDGTDRRIL